jgi:glutathione S-transferase
LTILDNYMQNLILHHYDPSPFSEKIRLVMGLKELHWHSVIVPMVVPKPDLMPLTGGNRRTPVLQIGANIYIGTGLIAAELERRFADPTLYPERSQGLCEMLSIWADEVLFFPSSRYAIRHDNHFSPSFHQDRAAMRGHAPVPAETLHREAPHHLEQLQLNLAYLEQTLAKGLDFLLGDSASVADFAIYARLWWALLYSRDQEELRELPQVRSWAKRISLIGHGERKEMTAAAALDIAQRATPVTPDSTDHSITAIIGNKISVSVESYGPDPVQGTVAAVTDDALVLSRCDARVGAVLIHLPRRGYQCALITS